MSKRENEAVVNRYLLSTLFLVIFEFGLYLMNNLSRNPMTARMFSPLTYFLMIAGVAGAVLFAVLGVIKKVKLPSAVYYIVLFLMIFVIGVFLKFYYILPFGLNVALMNVATRLKLMGIMVAAVYVYEVIRYFLNVNK